jgi:hypothetical protein
MLRRSQRRRLIIPNFYIPLVVLSTVLEFRHVVLFSRFDICCDLCWDCGSVSRMYQQRWGDDRHRRGNACLRGLFPIELVHVCYCGETRNCLAGDSTTSPLLTSLLTLHPVTKNKGYGVIFPATGASGFYVPSGCVVVGVLGSFEAYLGVLFAGFCCAILFRKVLRSQNLAQVFFSDPIVVRFGKAELSNREWSDNRRNLSYVDSNVSLWRSEDYRHNIMMTLNENRENRRHHDEELGVNTNDSSLIAAPRVKYDDNDNSNNNIPCPSLEFRLVNRLHDVPSGEIGKSVNKAAFD